jgi:ABC-type multidrug transport system fused ATPase/permease subunit
MTTPIGTQIWMLYGQLSPRRRLQFGLLFILMLISALAEVISIGAVFPFIGVLADPERIFKVQAVASFAAYAGMTEAKQLILPLTIAFALSAIVAGALRMFLLWVGTRICFACASELSSEVYRRTLNQPYILHLSRNSSEVIASTTSKIDGVTFGVIQPLLALGSSLVLLVSIVAVMFAVNPYVAAVSMLAFGSSYALVTWLSRNRLKQNSKKIAREQTQVIKALQEGLGGIRDVLLDGSQAVYCDIYKKADRPLRHAQGDNVFISGSPRFVVESIGMVLIATLAYQLTTRGDGLASAIPVLAALALGAQRLLPALQNIYSAWATIVASQSALEDSLKLLMQEDTAAASATDSKQLPFEKEIRFEQVHFRYSDDTPWILKGLDLAIAKGSRVGFIGATGSGKSTALDVLMGLLVPGQGAVLVDGKNIHAGNVRDWMRDIAHVPQSIYLADASIAENIAFGVPYDLIDMDRVRGAAAQARIAEYIESQPEAYRLIVGERGVRLSGGQRQRIGIARALYKQASVLVFDEATSALDNATELSVMQAIESLGRDLTVLIIAHRLTTVKNCDLIIELKEGKVFSQGAPAEILANAREMDFLGDNK